MKPAEYAWQAIQGEVVDSVILLKALGRVDYQISGYQKSPYIPKKGGWFINR
jgi:hypothetical protein